MITNFQIFEGKQVGVLYHFTSIYYLLKILDVRNPYLKRGWGRIYLSCTRNYDMKSRELKLEKQCCRITLDGNKLSQKYKIEPALDPLYPDREEREERIKMLDIMYMTEKELLNTHFSFIFKVKYVEDGHVPIGYDTIGVLGNYNEYYSTLMEEHDKCKGYDLPLLPDRGNFYSLKSRYVDSEHANYYGKS